LLSKILLLVLLFKLASKLGLRSKWQQLKPRLDRAVNITIVVLVVAYTGQLLWLMLQSRSRQTAPNPPGPGQPTTPAGGQQQGGRPGGG
jgi:hypothetical protein